MDGSNRGRLGQAQHVAVAAEIARMVAKTLAAEVGLGEVVGLEHRAHRPVEDDDPVTKDARQHGEAGDAIEGCALASVGEGRGDGGEGHSAAAATAAAAIGSTG